MDGWMDGWMLVPTVGGIEGFFCRKVEKCRLNIKVLQDLIKAKQLFLIDMLFYNQKLQYFFIFNARFLHVSTVKVSYTEIDGLLFWKPEIVFESVSFPLRKHSNASAHEHQEQLI